MLFFLSSFCFFFFYFLCFVLRPFKVKIQLRIESTSGGISLWLNSSSIARCTLKSISTNESSSLQSTHTNPGPDVGTKLVYDSEKCYFDERVGYNHCRSCAERKQW